MSAPPKPWASQNSLYGQSRPILSSHPNQMRPETVRRVVPLTYGIPPPVPPRPATMGTYRPPMVRSNYGYGYTAFSSPYDYSGYPYSGYRNFGMPSVYGYGRRYGTYDDLENRFIQIAEESSRPAFQSIESLVRAFTSVSMMLESTFHATYTSFRAVLDVADNFSRLRQLLVQFFSVFSLLRIIYSYYKRLLYRLGIGKDPTNDLLWQQVVNVIEEKPRQSVWPIFTFLGLMFGGPYIMSKLLRNFQSENDQGKSWDPSKEPGVKVVALYPYEVSSEGELSFAYGECLYVAPDQEQILNSSAVGWLLAANESNCVGYVPSNYVCRPNSTSSSVSGRLHKLQSQHNSENVLVHQNRNTDPLLGKDVTPASGAVAKGE